jgi:DNA-binding winged helix-turn-helix (wHTH) protein
MNLRKKIEPNPDQPRYVQTAYGMGYKFAEDTIESISPVFKLEGNDVQ